MTTITALRPLVVGGARIAVNGTANVSDDLAKELVWNGDATATIAAPPVVPQPGVVINPVQINGESYGANDSGGAGYKVLRVPNAQT